jgi:hypothetical protein
MLIIELNVAGHRFSGQIPDLHRRTLSSLRVGRRTAHRYIPQLRLPAA